MVMTEKQREIERLYRLKISNPNIAKIMGLTTNQVNRVIYKELELQSKNKMASMDEIRRVAKLRGDGLKLREIGDQLGYSINRVKYLLEAS